MEIVHRLIGFIKTVIFIVLGAGIGFALGAMTHPYAQIFGIQNIVQAAFDGDGLAQMFAQGMATNGIVGAVIGALVGWLIAWLTRRKPAVAVQSRE